MHLVLIQHVQKALVLMNPYFMVYKSSVLTNSKGSLRKVFSSEVVLCTLIQASSVFANSKIQELGGVAEGQGAWT